MSVYEKVRAYIDENGMKQVAVAQKAGISNVTFNAIMNGKRTMYADDLRAICLALNTGDEEITITDIMLSEIEKTLSGKKLCLSNRMGHQSETTVFFGKLSFLLYSFLKENCCFL